MVDNSRQGRSPLGPGADFGFYFVYVLWSVSLGRSYVGIALDTERRLRQHNGELAGGARATRCGRPWRIASVYGPYSVRGDALRAERAIKTFKGRARLELLPQPNPPVDP